MAGFSSLPLSIQNVQAMGIGLFQDVLGCAQESIGPDIFARLLPGSSCPPRLIRVHVE